MRFDVVLRGYDPAVVDALVRRANDALASDDAGTRATARAALGTAAVPVVLRGYDRLQVDDQPRQLASELG